MTKPEIVDCHTHICHPYMIDDFLHVMDNAGYGRAAALSIPFPGVGTFNAATLAAKASAPDRIYAFCCIDYRNLNSPDFAETSTAAFEKCLAAGADGIKMLLGKPGLPTVHFPLTHPRMHLIYEWFEAKQVPVYLHAGDPAYFWDKTKVYDFATDVPLAGCYADHDIYPTQDEIRKEVVTLINEYPDIRFLLCHLAVSPDKLSWLASILDRSPRIMTDISAPYILGAFAHNPRESRDFLETYADRVCFGTDAVLTIARVGNEWRKEHLIFSRAYRRFLETDDTIEVTFFPKPLRGIKLSRDTLERIYHDNYSTFVGDPKPIGDSGAFNSILDESIATMNSLETVPGRFFIFNDIIVSAFDSRKAAFRDGGAAALDDWVFNEFKIPEEYRTRTVRLFEKLKR